MSTCASPFKVLFISIIALVAIPLRPVFGQENEEAEEQELEEEFSLLEDEANVVESAARHQQDIGMSPSAVTVITRADIAASGADNLADLFRLVPGVDVATDTPAFSSVNGRLYWGNENQHFLVLIDGREANDDLIGVTLLVMQPVFLEDIERIEIIRGPGSTLYGANALAGVISITTRSVPRKTSAWAGLSAGEPGAMLAAGRAAAVVGDWGISLSGGYDYTGSYLDARSRGHEVGKARLLIQRPLAEKTRIMLDSGYSHGHGYFSTHLGRFDATFDLLQTRLALDSPQFRTHFYYQGELLEGGSGNDIYLAGSRLASISDMRVWAHILDGELQWNIPEMWKPLLLIAGARVRGGWIVSDGLLDGSGFSDPGSSRYHRPGISWSELRAGGFLHAELNPADWVAVTAGGRLDYNTTSGLFVSPRLAAVFQPRKNHFLRLAVSRSFRKPSFQESNLHMDVSFPPDSPIQGTDQMAFREFMSRSVGNPDLGAEKIWAMEAGYRVRLLEGRLSAGVEVYGNYHTDIIDFHSDVVTTPEGMIDLQQTDLSFGVGTERMWIWGVELELRYLPNDNILLQAAWSHREVIDQDRTPKNLLLLGGRVHTDFGLLGSLYLSTRSEFWDRSVENPRGMLSPSMSQHLPSVGVVLGRIGYRWQVDNESSLEIGARLYLPVDLEDFSLNYQGRGGGTAADGYHYGGEQLGRRCTLYLEGSI